MNWIWKAFWTSLLASTFILGGQAEWRQHPDSTITDTNKIEYVINCTEIIVNTALWSFYTWIEFCTRFDTLLRTNHKIKEISFVKRWEQALPVVNNINVFLNCFNNNLQGMPSIIVPAAVLWWTLLTINENQLAMNAVLAAENCRLK
jgi:hypothetical protein